VGFFPAAIRPLRHFADFRGRSTRSELIAFYLLCGLARILLDHMDWLFDRVAILIAEDALDVAIFVPTISLMVRRLHDQGRSAWWLLVAAPVAGANVQHALSADYSHYPYVTPDQTLAWPLFVPALVSALAFLILLFLDDEPEANRYGPNPRLDEPTEAELPSAQSVETARS
jgi:uncharacterized membrane protein YhaH (DUF805 family)